MKTFAKIVASLSVLLGLCIPRADAFLTFTGKVTDNSGNALANATVILYLTYADPNGKYLTTNRATKQNNGMGGNILITDANGNYTGYDAIWPTGAKGGKVWFQYIHMPASLEFGVIPPRGDFNATSFAGVADSWYTSDSPTNPPDGIGITGDGQSITFDFSKASGDPLQNSSAKTYAITVVDAKQNAIQGATVQFNVKYYKQNDTLISTSAQFKGTTDANGNASFPDKNVPTGTDHITITQFTVSAPNKNPFSGEFTYVGLFFASNLQYITLAGP
jgi:hypothetical protein